MKIQELVSKWFKVWTEGNFEDIPVSEDFKHTSPYGTIDGKAPYLDLVVSNKDKFLDNTYELHDELYFDNKACVRYTVHSSNNNFILNVSEWYYAEDDLLKEVISYYNIEGEISQERTLRNDHALDKS